VKELEKLAPFGMGNPQPTFYSEGTLIDAKIFGKKEEHLRFLIKEDGSFPYEFVSFYTSIQFTELSKSQKIKLVYTLGINRWNNEEKVQGKIINVL
jgi:single-stranded-DNA-specific exonuclease